MRICTCIYMCVRTYTAAAGIVRDKSASGSKWRHCMIDRSTAREGARSEEVLHYRLASG